MREFGQSFIMRSFRFLKTYRSRRLAASGGVGLVWLTLVYLLPPRQGNVVAAVGMAAALLAYCWWAMRHPTERPTWGFFINVPLTAVNIKLSAEVEAMILTQRERQTLLRAAQAESHPEQELLHHVADVEECSPQEMLRSSDKL